MGALLMGVGLSIAVFFEFFLHNVTTDDHSVINSRFNLSYPVRALDQRGIKRPDTCSIDSNQMQIKPDAVLIQTLLLEQYV